MWHILINVAQIDVDNIKIFNQNEACKVPLYVCYFELKAVYVEIGFAIVNL